MVTFVLNEAELLNMGFSRPTVAAIRTLLSQREVNARFEEIEFSGSRDSAAALGEVEALRERVDALTALVLAMIEPKQGDELTPVPVEPSEIDGGTITGTIPITRIGAVDTTGAQAATFSATNKPGVSTAGPTAWLTLDISGTPYHIPLFGN